MARHSEDSPPDRPEAWAAVGRVAAIVAVAAACALPVLLAIRPISSLDLGYHLAYGEHFLDTGQIVDTNPYIYTVDAPAGHRRDDLGPGCWYDAQGRYHFPNANWLTQVAMAGVHRHAGANGLCAMQVALVAGTFALILVVMRRLRLPWALTAAGMLLMALGAYPRFSLRPELVSYLLLAGQLAILVGGRPRWRSAAALVGIHLLFVNAHSFWPLSVGLTGAFLVDAALRMWWLGMKRSSGGRAVAAVHEDAYRATRRRTLLLAGTLAGQLAVSFVNPWTWRIVVLPVQTLMFLRAHGVGRPGASTHSWARIGELFHTLTPGFPSVKATVCYWALLVLTALGALAAVVRRRWAWLALMAGLTASSIGHRRNIAIAPLLSTPIVLAAIWDLIHPWTRRASRRAARMLPPALAGIVALTAGWFILATVRQRFYYNERLPYRLGGGYARVVLPLGAAKWLNEHRPEGRLWTDFDTSSNIHYFTRPHLDVPVLTNTWAQPPSVIGDVMDACEGTKDFSAVERGYEPQVLVLGANRGNVLLLRRLVADPAWAVAHLDAAHVVFLRADGPNAALAARSRITPQSLDLAAYKEYLAGVDPVPAYPMLLGGLALHYLGWNTQAIDVIRAALDLDGRYAGAWAALGVCYAARGTERLAERDIAPGKADLREAVKCLQTALRLNEDLDKARANLHAVQSQLAQY